MANQPRINTVYDAQLDAVLTSEIDNYHTTAIGATFNSYIFALNLMLNNNEYTGLFDEYRVNLVELWLVPITSAQGTTIFSTVYSAIDKDDGNIPVNVQTVAAKQDSIICNGGAGIYHRFIPSVADALYAGAFTSFGNVPSNTKWIDCASPGVQHYGVKMAFAGTAGAITYRVSTKMHCTFKRPGI